MPRVDAARSYNVKKLSTYYEALDAGHFPVERGYRLSPDDQVRRHVITQLMCNFHLDGADVARRFAIDFPAYFERELAELREGPVRDGFLEMDGVRLDLTAKGRLFVRNVCMVFDRYLREKTAEEKPVFSRTV